MKTPYRFSFSKWLIAFSAIFLVLGCNKKQDVFEQHTTQTLLQLTSQDADLSLFTAALNRVAPQQVLSPNATYTLFAPNNAGFRAYLKVTTDGDALNAINGLPPKDLLKLLQYHIVLGKINITNLPQNGAISTLRDTTGGATGRVFVRQLLSVTRINEATVVVANLTATDGVIQKIDKVLVEPTQDITSLVRHNPDLTILAAMLDFTGYANTFQQKVPTTLLAPSDESLFAYFSFLKLKSVSDLADSIRLSSSATAVGTYLRLLVKPILQAHIISKNKVLFAQDFVTLGSPQPSLNIYSPITGLQAGTGVALRGVENSTPSNVILADQVATNGVVQVLDRLITPSFTLYTNISVNPDLSIYSATLAKNGTGIVLNGAGNFTVFAPSNAAMRAYYRKVAGLSGTDDQLIYDILHVDPNDLVLNGAIRSLVFQYLIVNDSTIHSAADLPTQGTVYSILGVPPQSSIDLPLGSVYGRLFIDKTSGSVVLNGISKVTTADLFAVNGVYHILDTLFTTAPADMYSLSLGGVPQLYPNLTVWVAACQKAGILGMLEDLGPYTIYPPSDSAFNAYFGLTYASQSVAKINSYSLDDINKVLIPLLNAHILAQHKVVYNRNEALGGQFATLNAGVMLTVTNKTVSSNGKPPAVVIARDLQCTNGVASVINKVLEVP